jgi:hypothetical protein
MGQFSTKGIFQNCVRTHSDGNSKLGQAGGLNQEKLQANIHYAWQRKITLANDNVKLYWKMPLLYIFTTFTLVLRHVEGPARADEIQYL